MNPKHNYSTALQEDARRFEERLNGAGDISSFGTTVRNKRHAGVVVVVVVSHIQRIGCQPEKNYFTRWPIPLVVC